MYTSYPIVKKGHFISRVCVCVRVLLYLFVSQKPVQQSADWPMHHHAA